MKDKIKNRLSSLLNNSNPIEKTNTTNGVSLSKKGLFNKDPKKLSQPSQSTKKNVNLEILKIDFSPDISHLFNEQDVLDVTFDLTVPSGLDQKQVESHLVKLKLAIKKYNEFIKSRQADFEKVVEELEKANNTTQEVRHEMEIFSLKSEQTENDYLNLKELYEELLKENKMLKNRLSEFEYKKTNKITNENQKALPELF